MNELPANLPVNCPPEVENVPSGATVPCQETGFNLWIFVVPVTELPFTFATISPTQPLLPPAAKEIPLALPFQSPSNGPAAFAAAADQIKLATQTIIVMHFMSIIPSDGGRTNLAYWFCGRLETLGKWIDALNSPAPHVSATSAFYPAGQENNNRRERRAEQDHRSGHDETRIARQPARRIVGSAW